MINLTRSGRYRKFLPPLVESRIQLNAHVSLTLKRRTIKKKEKKGASLQRKSQSIEVNKIRKQTEKNSHKRKFPRKKNKRKTEGEENTS